MRFLSPLVVLALLAPSLASANELSRVYGLALQNDAQLQAAASARDVALESKPIALGVLLPQVNATGTYGYQDQRVLRGVFPSTYGTQKLYGANLSQTLFNRAQWLRLRQASDTVALAEAKYEAAEQSLALRTTQAYFDVLAAADNVHFVDAEKKAFDRQLELAKKRFEVGLSAVTDVQEAQARYDLSVAQMIAAEQALDSAKIALAVITGGGSDSRIVLLKEEIPLLGPNPANVNDWLKLAVDGNLDLRAAEITAESAQKDIKISSSQHWPTVAATGSYSNSDSHAGLFPSKTETTQVGATVTVPIFAGGATQAAVRQAEHTLEQRKAELETARRTVEQTTRNAYQGVIAGVAQVKALKQAVLSNTTALEASQVGLEVGSRTQVDVLNAEQLLYGAQKDYSKSRYDYLLSILKLKIAAGVLTQKDLNEIDGLLGAEAAADVAGSQ